VIPTESKRGAIRLAIAISRADADYNRTFGAHEERLACGCCLFRQQRCASGSSRGRGRLLPLISLLASCAGIGVGVPSGWVANSGHETGESITDCSLGDRRGQQKNKTFCDTTRCLSGAACCSRSRLLVPCSLSSTSLLLRQGDRRKTGSSFGHLSYCRSLLASWSTLCKDFWSVYPSGGGKQDTQLPVMEISWLLHPPATLRSYR
jgi:hypothetical protein